VRFSAVDPDFATVLSHLDSTAALRHASEVVHRTLGADVAAGAERLGEDDAMVVTMVVRTTVGTRTEQLNGLVIGPQQGLGGQAAVRRRVVAVADYCASPAITHDFDEAVRAEGLISVMTAPIIRAHRLYGCLYAGRRSSLEWSDNERSELLALARQTAIAMEVAESAREMAEVAVYDERQRLAVRLHDSIGATLFSLRAALESARAKSPKGPVLDLITDAIELAQRSASELRTQSVALHTAPEEKALAVGIRGDCRDFTERTGVDAGLVVLGDLPHIQLARAEALRLAIREALLNVEKHSTAQSVVVSLYPADDGLGVSVTDDGRPSDTSSNSDGFGLGLRTTAERVARAGGWLEFEEIDGGGHKMQVWVPAAKVFRPAEP
jgi:signal transduction histidine kinase